MKVIMLLMNIFFYHGKEEVDRIEENINNTFFIGNSIFHLSLELLTDFGKMRLKVA